MDIDAELKPDHIGSVLQMPFPDKHYDVVCCFQVLEHLPYENFEAALSELFRVARRGVIISLPDAGKVLQLHISKICKKQMFTWPFSRRKEHKFDGQHYWEINKKGYELNKIKDKIQSIGKERSFILEKEYRVWENAFHHFFIFKNIDKDSVPCMIRI